MELLTARSTRNKRRAWMMTLLLVIGGVWLVRSVVIKPAAVISPIPDAPVEKRSFQLFARTKNPDDLEKKIHNIMDTDVKDYSVFVEDFASPFTLALSETETFIAASVNKIPILAALYFEAEKGTVDLDKVITVQSQDIQDYGTGSIRYEGAGSTYSIKTLAKLMIKQSDNTAAYILANQVIGFDRLKELVAQWGLTQTDMVENKTSNKDMATLLRKLYEGHIANQAYTQEMLSFLKDTDFETRLPASLPKGVTVYHKIGTEVGNIHDVGIVTNGKHTYYIGIFTNDVTDDVGTEQIIAKASKAVYDFMQ